MENSYVNQSYSFLKENMATIHALSLVGIILLVWHRFVRAPYPDNTRQGYTVGPYGGYMPGSSMSQIYGGVLSQPGQ